MSSGCRKHSGCPPFCFDGSRGERGLPRVSHGFRALIQLPHRAGQTTQERPPVAPKQTGRNVDEAGRSRSHWKTGRAGWESEHVRHSAMGRPRYSHAGAHHGTIVIMIALRSSRRVRRRVNSTGLIPARLPLSPLSTSRTRRLAQQQQQQQQRQQCCGCLEPSAFH